MTVFISLLVGWKKKIILLYLAIFLAKIIFLQSLYVSGVVHAVNIILRVNNEAWGYLIKMISHFTALIFYTIMICELLNFMRSDSKRPDTLLLNLDNEYNKTGSFIGFWVYKTGILMIALGASTFIRLYFRSDYLWTQNKDYIDYILISGAISIIGSIGLSLYSAWYLRRLLLEYFITYNVRSKFLYWLAIVPLLGVLSFLFMETKQVKPQNYKEKVNTIEKIAGSSTLAITIISFFILLLRYILELSGNSLQVYFTLAIISLLFTWIIFSRIGYYITGGIILASMVGILYKSNTAIHFDEEWMAYYGVLVIGLSQLVMFFLVYHFSKFFYTPAEDPDPESAQSQDLFV